MNQLQGRATEKLPTQHKAPANFIIAKAFQEALSQEFMFSAVVVSLGGWRRHHRNGPENAQSGGNSLSWVCPLRFCKRITSSLAEALPSIFLKSFRPLEANIREANAREKKEKRKMAQILYMPKCNPQENKPSKSWWASKCIS